MRWSGETIFIYRGIVLFVQVYVNASCYLSVVNSQYESFVVAIKFKKTLKSIGWRKNRHCCSPRQWDNWGELLITCFFRYPRVLHGGGVMDHSTIAGYFLLSHVNLKTIHAQNTRTFICCVKLNLHWDKM